MSADDWMPTDRGFLVASTAYAPYQGEPLDALTVQESSLATENRVWVGPRGGDRMHLNVETATWLRDRLTEWLAREDWTNEGVDAAVERIREREGDYLADLEWLAGLAYVAVRASEVDDDSSL